MTDKRVFIDVNLSMAKGEHFNEIYFNLHRQMMGACTAQASRNGATLEALHFKTTVTNPVKRCVGGYNRDINIFFLLAEALWIFAGRKDVAFLDTYNSMLKQYSDDGHYYHAPYGFRIRHYGQHSLSNRTSPYSVRQFDQLQAAVELLDKNPDDRRVVLQIWNAHLDLGEQSKDLPCNDLVFWKIRNGKLYTTIANRSNDLNLGLTTNFFQFSFLSEVVARILDVELGDETHNSDSLHIYTEFDVTKKLLDSLHGDGDLLYEYCTPTEMQFNFQEFWPTHGNSKAQQPDVVTRFNLVDNFIKSMVTILHKVSKDEQTIDEMNYLFIELKKFSEELFIIAKLLYTFAKYKQKKFTRYEAFSEILELHEIYGNLDIVVLGLNFFASRMSKSPSVSERAFVERFKGSWAAQSPLSIIGTF